MTRRPRARSIRARLVLLISATLVVVCTAMALTTALVQRAALLGNLDDRVTDAAERSLGGALLHPGRTDGLGFLNENGHPAGLLAARLDEDGDILSAAVVSQDAAPQDLTDAQRAALEGIAADGSRHTRTVPGLGTYRVAVLDSDGVRVLTGLPMADVQQMISGTYVPDPARPSRSPWTIR